MKSSRMIPVSILLKVSKTLFWLSSLELFVTFDCASSCLGCVLIVVKKWSFLKCYMNKNVWLFGMWQSTLTTHFCFANLFFALMERNNIFPIMKMDFSSKLSFYVYISYILKNSLFFIKIEFIFSSNAKCTYTSFDLHGDSIKQSGFLTLTKNSILLEM